MIHLMYFQNCWSFFCSEAPKSINFMQKPEFFRCGFPLFYRFSTSFENVTLLYFAILFHGESGSWGRLWSKTFTASWGWIQALYVYDCPLFHQVQLTRRRAKQVRLWMSKSINNSKDEFISFVKISKIQATLLNIKNNDLKLFYVLH